MLAVCALVSVAPQYCGQFVCLSPLCSTQRGNESASYCDKLGELYLLQYNLDNLDN